MIVNDIAKELAKDIKAAGGDVEKFASKVYDLAIEEGRVISMSLDPRETAQLKAALQFLYGLADGALAALKTDDGNANPDSEEGFL